MFNRLVTIGALGGGFIVLLLSVAYGSLLGFVFAAAFFTLSIVMWKYSYLLVPVLTRATNIVEIRGGYEIPSTRDYIIRKTNDGYYATKFLEINFYESTLDKKEGEKAAMLESFEKAIGSLKYVVKISLLLSAVDLSKHIDDIKTKRSSAEAKKSKLGNEDSQEVIRIDREIAMWNRLLSRITRGDRPIELVAFASTTAFGLTREEASARVRRQGKEVSTILSSSLGCDISDLVDLDMIKCFEWETFFPTTSEELRDELF